MVTSSQLLLRFLTATFVALSESTQGTTLILTDRQVSGAGFHRSLHTEVEVRALPPHCMDSKTQWLILREELDETQYIDFDEVWERRRLREPNTPVALGFGFSGTIDVERPSYTSQPHSVALVLTEGAPRAHRTALHGKFQVPLHFRYQSPQMDSLYRPSTVKVPSEAYLCCGSAELALWERGDSTKVHILAADGPNHSSSVHVDGLQCDKIKIVSDGVSSVEILIPVGRLEDKVVVIYVTTAVTMTAALFLACFFATMSRNRRSSPKSQKLD